MEMCNIYVMFVIERKQQFNGVVVVAEVLLVCELFCAK